MLQLKIYTLFPRKKKKKKKKRKDKHIVFWP